MVRICAAVRKDLTEHWPKIIFGEQCIEKLKSKNLIFKFQLTTL